jgi:hypothetical protein
VFLGRENISYFTMGFAPRLCDTSVSKHYKFFANILIGMGKSDKPILRYSTSEMAKDLIELLDHLGWTSPRELNVTGVSMGGMICQELVLPPSPLLSFPKHPIKPRPNTHRASSSPKE